MMEDVVIYVPIMTARILAPVSQVMNCMLILTLTTLAWQMEKQEQEPGIK